MGPGGKVVVMDYMKIFFFLILLLNYCVQLEGERERAEKELKAQKEKVQLT